MLGLNRVSHYIFPSLVYPKSGVRVLRDKDERSKLNRLHEGSGREPYYLKLSKERPWHSDSAAHEHKSTSSLGLNFHFDYFSAMHALEKFLNLSEPVFPCW